MYSFLLALIYIAFISLGLPDSLLGSGWPTMHENLGVPLSYMGIVSMIISGGTIVSSLFSDRLTRRLGTATVTIVSVFLTAAALLGFSVSTSFWMLLLFAIPYGLGAGAIDAALNNYVALYYTSKHMSWLHCFWGVGTIVSPYVMSYALTNSVWNDGYKIVAYIQIGIGVFLLLTSFAWKINKGKTDLEGEDKGLRLSDAIKIKGVPYILLGFLGYCAAEATTMIWASSYLAEVRGVAKDLAAAFGALFYIGITVGRFLGGFIMDFFGDKKMIRIGTVILFTGAFCVLLPVKTDILNIIGFIIIGLGCAPIYPCIIHSTPENFGAENSGAIIGIQMASAYVGSTFIPPLFGYIGRFTGLKILPVYIGIFVVIMWFMVEKTFKVSKEQ